MPVATRAELEEFSAFVIEQLRSGGADQSPEEVLDLWRGLHPDPAELAANVAAIREALADMEAGDPGRPLDDVLRDIRQELKIARQR